MCPLENSPDPVAKLVFELSKLPGIGEKTATRLAYYILKQDDAYARSLSQAVIQAKEKITLCNSCFTFTDTDPCRICASTQRDSRILCVVEKPSDVFAIEQTQSHRWKYHVLHGCLSPLDGIGPDDLKIKELLLRLDGARVGDTSIQGVAEVILATNPSVEGEATARYLMQLLRPLGVKVTKLAYGLPMGGLIEYADRQTLHRALENRVEMH